MKSILRGKCLLIFSRKKNTLKKPPHSYFGNGFQQAEVDVDESIKVFIGEPEAFHIKLQLTTISKVRDLLGQHVAAQDQWVVLHKVLIHELLSWQTKKIKNKNHENSWQQSPFFQLYSPNELYLMSLDLGLKTLMLSATPWEMCMANL